MRPTRASTRRRSPPWPWPKPSSCNGMRGRCARDGNASAVSILLPAISEDTGMSVTTLQWAVTGYSLVGAAVIITAGSLGDVFGRRRIFQLGLLLFVASCVMIALADSGGMVIAGRAIQGAAGATIL